MVERRRRWGRVVLGVSMGGMAVLSGLRLRASDSVPWAPIGLFLVGATLLAGPVAWLARGRLPEQHREQLGYVLVGAALLAFPFVLGLGLLAGTLLVVWDAAVLGSVIGVAAVLVVERVAVPDRLRGGGR
jgi:uncharacterized membrane protein